MAVISHFDPIANALHAVVLNGVSFADAAETCGISQWTLRRSHKRWMSNPPARQPCDPQDFSVAIPKPGLPQVLHEDEEDLIAEAAMYFARNNTPLTRQNLCELTKHLAQMMPSARRRRVPFLTRPPSKACLNGFSHRHPGLSVQAVRCMESDRLERVTRANVAEHIARVQKAMRRFRIYDPRFIFNLDESA